MYLVLARKYRPKDFDEVCGQKHITDVLKKAIRENKVAHAYIFSGPRGTGKTSAARILARSLNCETGPTTKPCGKCDICTSITAGTCLDVLEIDGASNRGIDEIRSLRENVNLTPAKAAFKIYIIDEVHMLTAEACNALLKTLEEPPDYVKFLFATTAPEKIMPTILSRCQRFNFQPFRREEIESKLTDICAKEGFSIEADALRQIYGFSGGSLRDALGILDQLIVNADGNKITYGDVKDFLGLIEEDSLNEILTAFRNGDVKTAIIILHRLLEEGKDPALILDGLVKKFKNLLLCVTGQADASLDENKQLAGIFANVDIETMINAVSLIIEYKERLRRENLPVILSEILFLRIGRLLSNGKTPAIRPEKTAPEKKKAADIFSETTEKSAPAPQKEKTPDKDLPALDPEDVMTTWNTVRSELKKSKPTLEAALREGTPVKIEGDTLFVNFAKTYAFHKSMVEKPASMKLIEKNLSKITGGKISKVRFILENKPEDSLLNNNEVKKIVDFFNGEIVKLEE